MCCKLKIMSFVQLPENTVEACWTSRKQEHVSNHLKFHESTLLSTISEADTNTV